MSVILDKLNEWGCDVAGALERVADDEDFYIECLREVAEDPYFALLGERLEAGDIRGAFDAAHTLKGVFANVGLTPLYNKTVEIVEPLRGGHHEGLKAQLDQLEQMQKYLRSLLKNT